MTLTAARFPGAVTVWSPDSVLARLGGSSSTGQAAATSGELGGIAGWAVGVMEALGVFGAALLIFAENLFPPLPSEVILPLAGFTASLGTFSLLWVIVATTVGSVLGALLLYGLGAGIGVERLRALADRLPLMHGGDIDRAMDFFARHGGKAVFFGRMVPLFRSLISVPAGVQRMPLPKFVLLSTAGSLLWNTVFVLAGYLLGQNWALVEESAGVLQWVVIVAVVGAVTVFVTRRVRQQRARAPRGDTV